MPPDSRLSKNANLYLCKKRDTAVTWLRCVTQQGVVREHDSNTHYESTRKKNTCSILSTYNEIERSTAEAARDTRTPCSKLFRGARCNMREIYCSRRNQRILSKKIILSRTGGKMQKAQKEKENYMSELFACFNKNILSRFSRDECGVNPSRLENVKAKLEGQAGRKCLLLFRETQYSAIPHDLNLSFRAKKFAVREESSPCMRHLIVVARLCVSQTHRLFNEARCSRDNRYHLRFVDSSGLLGLTQARNFSFGRFSWRNQLRIHSRTMYTA